MFLDYAKTSQLSHTPLDTHTHSEKGERAYKKKAQAGKKGGPLTNSICKG